MESTSGQPLCTLGHYLTASSDINTQPKRRFDIILKLDKCHFINIKFWQCVISANMYRCWQHVLSTYCHSTFRRLTSWRSALWHSTKKRSTSETAKSFKNPICKITHTVPLKTLRPTLNFTPRGKLWPPRGEVVLQVWICPLGAKLSSGGEILCSHLHSSKQ
jgi:hypothetical protein